MPIISVIVPVYNVEKYLKRCIDSILNQTFKEFELILVNDGSTDNCGKICDMYKRKDKRIRVIHKENGGLSSARNAGLDIAKGKYIAFVDSDDYINKNMYDILYSNLIKTDADISLCNFEYVYDNNNFSVNQSIDNYDYLIFNNIEALNKLYSENNTNIVVAWNKLYKKELFEGLRYTEGRIHEDEFIIHELLYKSKKIVCTNAELYYYLKRQGSITQCDFNLKKLDVVYAFKERVEFFREKKLTELQFKAQRVYIYSFFLNYYKAKIKLDNCNEELIKLKNDYNRNLIFVLMNPYFIWREKVLFILFFINPKFYEIYHKIKGIRLFED